MYSFDLNADAVSGSLRTITFLFFPFKNILGPSIFFLVKEKSPVLSMLKL